MRARIIVSSALFDLIPNIDEQFIVSIISIFVNFL